MNIVEFPNLGLKFLIDPVAFNVFGQPIYWYGIIIATAFLIAVLLGLGACRKFGFEPDNIIDLVLFSAPVAIVGARLYYVIFKWSNFKNNLIEILDFRSGGLALYGGIIGGLLTAFAYAKFKKLNIKKLFDFGSPYLILAQGIGRWGNFINAEAHGGITSLPWGMKINGSGPFHPTFLYEFLWDMVVFVLLLWYRRRKKVDGEVFYLYMILYGIGRMFIEGLRTDSLYLGTLRVSQVLAFLFAVVFTCIFVINRIRSLRTIEEPQLGSSEFGAVLREIKEEERFNGESVLKRDENIEDDGSNAAVPKDVLKTVEEPDSGCSGPIDDKIKPSDVNDGHQSETRKVDNAEGNVEPDGNNRESC